MENDCFLCSIANGHGREWYDQDLFGAGHGVVVPALGALAEGHVLVCPKAHVASVQDLAGADRSGFLDLLERVSRVLRSFDAEGAVTVFEHGAAISGSGPRSACTEHAHVQVLPGHFQLGKSIETTQRFDSLRTFYESDPPYYPYLMAEEGAGVVVATDVGQSQFFRREILRTLGEPDRWDYWVFQREGNLRKTVDTLRSADRSHEDREGDVLLEE